MHATCHNISLEQERAGNGMAVPTRSEHLVYILHILFILFTAILHAQVCRSQKSLVWQWWVILLCSQGSGTTNHALLFVLFEEQQITCITPCLLCFAYTTSLSCQHCPTGQLDHLCLGYHNSFRIMYSDLEKWQKFLKKISSQTKHAA